MSKGKLVLLVMCLLILDGCNRFHRTRLLESVGYKADECAVRDFTHHRAPEYDGSNPGRIGIWHREFRCRIERICVGKSEEENEKCRQAARDYWITGEGAEKGDFYKLFKKSDDQFDAICTLNKNPWNPNFKGCSPKWHPQENYATNPYWNKETKSYVLPEVIKDRKDSKKTKQQTSKA